MPIRSPPVAAIQIHILHGTHNENMQLKIALIEARNHIQEQTGRCTDQYYMHTYIWYEDVDDENDFMTLLTQTCYSESRALMKHASN